MKKVLSGLTICIVSLIITFITFWLMNWYHFGDIPTKVVTIRLIMFFVIVIVILTLIVLLIKKKKN